LELLCGSTCCDLLPRLHSSNFLLPALLPTHRLLELAVEALHQALQDLVLVPELPEFLDIELLLSHAFSLPAAASPHHPRVQAGVDGRCGAMPVVEALRRPGRATVGLPGHGHLHRAEAVCIGGGGHLAAGHQRHRGATMGSASQAILVARIAASRRARRVSPFEAHGGRVPRVGEPLVRVVAAQLGERTAVEVAWSGSRRTAGKLGATDRDPVVSAHRGLALL